MLRMMLATAAVTGVFCAGFAIVVDAVTDALSMTVAIGLAFVSGFLGSLIGQYLMRRGD